MRANATRNLRLKIAAKEQRLSQLEQEARVCLDNIGNHLQPGRLLGKAAHSIIREFTQPRYVYDLLAASAVFTSDRALFQKLNPALRALGMIAIRELVSNFILDREGAAN